MEVLVLVVSSFLFLSLFFFNEWRVEVVRSFIFLKIPPGGESSLPGNWSLIYQEEKYAVVHHFHLANCEIRSHVTFTVLSRLPFCVWQKWMYAMVSLSVFLCKRVSVFKCNCVCARACMCQCISFACHRHQRTTNSVKWRKDKNEHAWVTAWLCNRPHDAHS